MGAVIDDDGRNIMSIEKKTGAKVTSSCNPDFPNRFFIAAETEDAVERAKQEITRTVVSPV